VTDFAPGGLPAAALKFLQDNIGTHKCNDERTDVTNNPNRAISKGRSSRSGLPHIVELSHQLTASGGDDFDMNVTTRDSGTSFRMRFELNLMAPVSSETPIGKENIQQINGLSSFSLSLFLHLSVSDSFSVSLLLGTLLVVDDSMVIRKIISRYLDSLQCAHKVCVDGAQAWDWFVENHSSCAGVITDLEMPKMGGDALISKVQELSPGKPCFIVSGNDISPDKLPSGALRAIIKPITSDQIQLILSEIYAIQQAAMEINNQSPDPSS
jgi:CheY-like chemotaxis protein